MQAGQLAVHQVWTVSTPPWPDKQALRALNWSAGSSDARRSQDDKLMSSTQPLAMNE